MHSPLERVVLVSGGTRGIGLACAERFLAQSCHVAVCGRNEKTVSDTARQLGKGCLGMVCDVSDAKAVNAMVERVVCEWGALHVLVNNAGITADGLVARMKDEEWHAVLNTHLSGAFYLCRAAARAMLRQRYGRIVTIGSVVGLRGQAGQCNYAAAKAGLIGFTKAYAREMASRNVTVNLVAPGFVETDMTSGMNESQRQAALEHIPLGRAGTAEEIAEAVAFLASDAAAYITGAVLPVDGGLSM